MQSLGFCNRLRQPCRWGQKCSFDRWSGVLTWRRGCCHLFVRPLSSNCRASDFATDCSNHAGEDRKKCSFGRWSGVLNSKGTCSHLFSKLRILQQIAATVQVLTSRKAAWVFGHCRDYGVNLSWRSDHTFGCRWRVCSCMSRRSWSQTELIQCEP